MSRPADPVRPTRRARRPCADLGDAYDLRVDPAARVGDLSVGDLQRVEILRALHRGARLLILDEPTAVLTPRETRRTVPGHAPSCARSGRTIVFISHKLEEVLGIADRITVLRDGRVDGRARGARRRPPRSWRG